jgi:chromosome segregation ATPase
MAELPLFAGLEAKKIFADIEKQRERLEKAQADYADHEERYKVMVEHLKNVRQEVQHTEGLASAKRAEVASEDHLAQMAKREAGRYRQELKREQQELEAIDSTLNALQNQVFGANEKMDGFKLQMNWNQEELEQWALASKQKEEDNLAIEKYTRADEAKINQLALQIEKLTKRDLEIQAQVEAEATETSSRQIELDRTAEEFRVLHAERQKLVQQWKETIEVAVRRDQDITKTATEYVQQKQAKEVVDVDLKAAREDLDKVQALHGELQTEVTARERQLQARREFLLSEQERKKKLAEEIDIIKTELANSARTLARRRADMEREKDEVVQRKTQLEQVRKLYHAAKRDYAGTDEKLAIVEKDASAAEKILKDAENEEVAEQRKLQTLKEKMFKASQELFDLRQIEASTIAEISGSQSQVKNLRHKIRALDKESVKQAELIYNAEYEIQLMERKLSVVKGERSDAEKKQLNAQIEKCKEELKEAKDQEKFLVNQTRKVNNEYTRSRRREEEAERDKVKLREKINTVEMESNAVELDLKQYTEEEQEAMVSNDVMRLEIKRLRDQLSERADKVFTLENRKQQLKLSMAERKKESAVHSDVQAVQLRLAEEEVHKVKMEINGRKAQINMLAAKYEKVVKSSSVRSEEGGEPKSQAYYMIQAAQKREELQRQGDELDQEIRRREREMRALEATLRHVNVRNTKYRTSFQKANMKSGEAEDMKQLEEQAKLAADALFRRKKELQRLATDFEEDDRRLRQVEGQCTRLEERNGHLAEAKQQMEVELAAQDEALEKHDERLSRLSALHRGDTEEETVQEKHFRAEGLRDATKSVLRTLGDLAKAYPELKDVLNATLQDHGLHPELLAG